MPHKNDVKWQNSTEICDLSAGVLMLPMHQSRHTQKHTFHSLEKCPTLKDLPNVVYIWLGSWCTLRKWGDIILKLMTVAEQMANNVWHLCLGENENAMVTLEPFMKLKVNFRSQSTKAHGLSSNRSLWLFRKRRQIQKETILWLYCIVSSSY